MLTQQEYEANLRLWELAVGERDERIRGLKDEVAKLEGQLATLRGDRNYARNRLRILVPLAQLLLGEERLPENNLDLASLVASYFRTAVSTTPESAMTPLLEGIIKSLSPAEETAPAEAAEVPVEQLLEDPK